MYKSIIVPTLSVALSQLLFEKLTIIEVFDKLIWRVNWPTQLHWLGQFGTEAATNLFYSLVLYSFLLYTGPCEFILAQTNLQCHELIGPLPAVNE